jgi:hypothetical protein
MICGWGFNGNMDNVETFATVLKSSAYAMSHGCFLFSTLFFRGEFLNFLHVLLSLNSLIYFTFISFDSNFNQVKAKISVLVPLHTVSDILLFFLIFEMKNYRNFCLRIIMAVSVCQ